METSDHCFILITFPAQIYVCLYPLCYNYNQQQERKRSYFYSSIDFCTKGDCLVTGLTRNKTATRRVCYYKEYYYGSTGSKDSATKLVMLGGPTSVILDHLSVI